MQAAVGCAQLVKFPGFVERRRHNFDRLKAALETVSDKLILPVACDNSRPSWFGFLITCNEGVDRNAVVQYIEDHGVQTRALFVGNLIKHPCFDQMRAEGEGYRIAGELTNTDRIMNDTFWVGVYPGMTDEMIDYMAKTIKGRSEIMQENGIGTRIWCFFENLGRVIVDAILGIFNIKISDAKWNAFMQFVKFGLVGVSNTLISYGVYLICLFAFGKENYLIGNVIGFIVSVLNSFYWNDKYVFKKKDGEERSKLKALIKVFLSYASTGLILSSILLVIFVKFIGIPETVAPLLGLLVTIPLNYIMNKVWAFKDGK